MSKSLECSIVTLVRGENRRSNISKALKIIEEDLRIKIEKRRIRDRDAQLFIKINTIDSNFSHACTHPEAIDAVIQFLGKYFERIVIGDNTYVLRIGAQELKKLGYLYLKKKYGNVIFSDLVTNNTVDVTLCDVNGRNTIAKISSLPLNSDFVVSLQVPKTHDTVIATGALKNMLGCVIKNRRAVHGVGQLKLLSNRAFVKSCKIIHHNLVNVFKIAKPDLAVIDGFEAMEGDGPIFGNPVKLEIALASTDPVAIDTIIFKIMGFDTSLIRYLALAEENGLGTTSMNKIEVLGEKVETVQTKFKRHRNYKLQTLYDETKVSRLSIDYIYVFESLRRFYRIWDKFKEKTGTFLNNL